MKDSKQEVFEWYLLNFPPQRTPQNFIHGFWDRVCLLFRRRQSIIVTGLDRTLIEYKEMKGNIYILFISKLPPEHHNCRHSFVGENGRLVIWDDTNEDE